MEGLLATSYPKGLYLRHPARLPFPNVVSNAKPVTSYRLSVYCDVAFKESLQYAGLEGSLLASATKFPKALS